MKTQFVTDNNGKKTAVLLPIKDYQKILEERTGIAAPMLVVRAIFCHLGSLNN